MNGDVVPFPVHWLRGLSRRKNWEGVDASILQNGVRTDGSLILNTISRGVHSALFSSCHFLWKYWQVLRYLKARYELSPFAYLMYGYEFFKAAAITMLVERNERGTACCTVMQGMVCKGVSPQTGFFHE